MKLIKNYIVIYFVSLFLFFSCSSNNNNQKAENSINDSIINSRLRTQIDSILLHSYINLTVNSLNISSSYTNNDTIKNIKGEGSCSRYNQYGKETFDIMGSYRVSQNKLRCVSLKVIHPNVGDVFAIFEKYDTLLTYYMDSLTFFKKNSEYVDRQYEIWEDRIYKVEHAYANRTKVHFGISKYEYNRLGEVFQRNFYEGLIGEGAFELAEPVFDKKDIFVGFKIRELHGKTFNYDHIYNAKLVKKEQLGYDAHECFRCVYYCELYNMETYAQYDKFEKRTNHSLECYWNKYLIVYR